MRAEEDPHRKDDPTVKNRQIRKVSGLELMFRNASRNPQTPHYTTWQ